MGNDILANSAFRHVTFVRVQLAMNTKCRRSGYLIFPDWPPLSTGPRRHPDPAPDRSPRARVRMRFFRDSHNMAVASETGIEAREMMFSIAVRVHVSAPPYLYLSGE
jgi:hypothetical protein